MKKYGLVFFLLAAGLFSGCSSSDTEAEKATSSGGMLIGVSLSSVATRVTETADASKGLITAWESTDSLRVFHKYTKNGTVGTMQGFKFTAAGTGSSTTFKYGGAAEYSFTSGNSLYAFNALPTAGNYTKTYSSSNNNFTLSLSGLGSQDGKVNNLKNYDAMYGVSSVVSDGTPSAMTMNHLLSVVRFDVSNAAFSGSLSSVKFTYTATSGSSLLPSFGGFTLSNAGTLATGTLTGATSWSVSNVAVSSGTAPVYLMTFPDTRSGTLTITATDSGGNYYSRTITLSNFSLTSGSMKAYKVTLNVAVAPPSESNSYIVAPGATIYIPVSRATTGNAANFPEGSSFTTGLLWSDVSATHVTPTVSDRYIKVVAGTTEGNSVVYAKNTSGNIVWSWHIWVTSYVPNTTTINYNTRVWMDRNLGATSTTGTAAYGMYYQWGRKDPFPGGTNYSVSFPATYGSSPATFSSVPHSLLTSIQNPNGFFKNAVSPYDWLTPQNDSLWNNSGKTIYDPCPTGWRVPLITEFSGVFPSNTFSGYWHSNGTFYNAASGACWWSGVFVGVTAYDMSSNGSVFDSYRSSGYSMRCVKN